MAVGLLYRHDHVFGPASGCRRFYYGSGCFWLAVGKSCLGIALPIGRRLGLGISLLWLAYKNKYDP